MAALQQLRICHCAGTNDFSAPWTDPGNLPPLLQGQLRNLFGDAAYHLACSVYRRPALSGALQVAGDTHQCSGCAGGGNDGAHTCGPDSILNARTCFWVSVLQLPEPSILHMKCRAVLRLA